MPYKPTKVARRRSLVFSWILHRPNTLQADIIVPHYSRSIVQPRGSWKYVLDSNSLLLGESIEQQRQKHSQDAHHDLIEESRQLSFHYLSFRLYCSFNPDKEVSNCQSLSCFSYLKVRDAYRLRHPSVLFLTDPDSGAGVHIQPQNQPPR